MSLQHTVILVGVLVALAIAFWPINQNASFGPEGGEAVVHRAFGDEYVQAQRAETTWISALAENDSIYGSSAEAVDPVVKGNGDVDLEILERQGFSPAEAIEVAKIVDVARRAMSDSFAARLEPDPSRTDEASGVFAYVIKGDRPRGDEILSTLRQGLVGICGPEKAEKLYLALRLRTQFGSFGREDVEIIVRAKEGSEIGSLMTVRSIDPQTRSSIAIDEISTIDQLRLFCGTAFEIQDLSSGGQ